MIMPQWMHGRVQGWFSQRPLLPCGYKTGLANFRQGLSPPAFARRFGATSRAKAAGDWPVIVENRQAGAGSRLVFDENRQVIGLSRPAGDESRHVSTNRRLENVNGRSVIGDGRQVVVMAGLFAAFAGVLP
jgi:hypothetical protein